MENVFNVFDFRRIFTLVLDPASRLIILLALRVALWGEGRASWRL